MRLICPNCEAQYNVADDAIPEGGRDVQCSNCQQTWFQTEKSVVAPQKNSRILSRPLMKEEFIDPAQESAATAISNVIAENASGAATGIVKEMVSTLEKEKSRVLSVEPVEVPRKGLDSAVADILREEAAREDSVPKPIPGSMQAPPPMTQTETRVEEVDADETRKRIAQMTEEEGGVRTGEAAVYEDRTRAMPDINEINATLRARAQASDTTGLTEEEKMAATQRRGFRGGFFFILILFVILIGPYFFADEITENLPQTSGFMAEYTTTIDQYRVQLNDLLGEFFE